jgi:hypothetical protein
MSRSTRLYVRMLTVVAAVAAVLVGTTFGGSPADAAATGSAPRSVLIILVNWAAGNGTPAAPPDAVTPATAAGQVGGTDVGWYQATSYGQFPGWNAAAIGSYLIAPPPNDGCGNVFRANIQAGGNQAALANGFDPANYSVVMYYFSPVPCGWGGWTVGSNIWINGSMITATTVHELGHTLLLGHGHSQTCVNGSGQQVALSGNCQSSEYGDVYNVMGCCGPGSFTAMQKFDLGWMSGRKQDVPASGGTYTLQPLEATAPGLQTLRVVDGNETFWLEYRQPIGVDNWLSPSSTQGVLIHRQLPEGLTQYGSNLLDMTPGSPAGFSDAGLPAGASWVDPLGTMMVTVNSVSAAGAQITVKSTIPVVPDVRGELAADAKSILQAAGYVVVRQPVVDHSCENIGLVVSQSPPGGTVLAAGSTVTVRIGVKPPHPCP